MKILYYNWVDYLDPEKRGGGVSIYQRNLIDAFADMKKVTVDFLSSGLSYDLRNRTPRWDVMHDSTSAERPCRFEIVNSGTLAPSHHSFGDLAHTDHAETETVFYDFITKNGPYDVVHFHNLEGVPAAVLGLKARWPNTKVILSLHNYYPICPQVNLWRQERKTCTDYAQGQHCATCLPTTHNKAMLRLSNGVAYRLKRLGVQPGSRVFDSVFYMLRIGAGVLRRLKGTSGRRYRRRGRVQPLTPPEGAPFAARRARMIDLINRHCDRVLCVSDAVRQLAKHYGIAPALCETDYIGTREATLFAKTAPCPIPMAEDGTLTLGYLGYMRRDKGFYFLLEALETLPKPMAKRLRLLIAARRGDAITMDRITDLSTRLAGLDYANGYRHDDLDRLLSRVDVGILPVLWHDNLPQVAIEMHARHIPLLTSDMGGAQELGNCADMVFPAGDIQAFHDRIAALLNDKVDFDAYWRGAKAPVEMKPHIDALMALYAA